MRGAAWCVLFAAALGCVMALETFERKASAEFHFLRMEYRDHPRARRSWGRGWWMQDWPEAEMHFNQGIRRMTRIDVGEIRHAGLHGNGIFEYPWIYATQVGWWDLSDDETRQLGDYLRRGGFLVVDDFFGPADWSHFAGTMARVLPDRPIEDMRDNDPVMNMVFEIKERVFIPGLRHLRDRGPNGVVIEPTGQPPAWRAIYDERGNILVAINFNVDVGDAWEHADMPEYPEYMTSLAYRFGINYIVYAMTH
jgi:hypothetical protein